MYAIGRSPNGQACASKAVASALSESFKLVKRDGSGHRRRILNSKLLSVK